jgi:hypothetical protein
MIKTLGACMFIYNGDKFDYSYRECIENMKSFADQVVVLAIESEDGCHVVCQKYADYKCKVIVYPESAWHAQQGREKLAYFQNEAKKYLETDYYMVIQGDECLHERSFGAVRDAVNSGLPAFMCTRYNLWFDSYHMLNVPQEQKPCSSEVIRLAHLKYDSVNDGENIDCPSVCFDLTDKIELFHIGFIRKPELMKPKIAHMLLEVFKTSYDPKLDLSDVFDPWAYFDRGDVVPINGPLPRFIQKWADERYPNGSIL